MIVTSSSQIKLKNYNSKIANHTTSSFLNPIIGCNQHFTLIGHRGSGALNPDIPENTKLAFNFAISQGIYFHELDVRLSKDKTLIIFHGLNLKNTTSGTGWIERKNTVELNQLNWGHYVKPDQKVTILTLEEYIKLFGNTCYTNIEIKREWFFFFSQIENEVARLVKTTQVEKRVLVSSWNIISLYKIKRLLPTVCLGILIYPHYWLRPWYTLISYLLQVDSVHIHAPKLSNSTVKYWKKKHKVIIWGENDPKRLTELAKSGVDMAIIDNLVRLKHLSIFTP